MWVKSQDMESHQWPSQRLCSFDRKARKKHFSASWTLQGRLMPFSIEGEARTLIPIMCREMVTQSVNKLALVSTGTSKPCFLAQKSLYNWGSVRKWAGEEGRSFLKRRGQDMLHYSTANNPWGDSGSCAYSAFHPELLTVCTKWRICHLWIMVRRN